MGKLRLKESPGTNLLVSFLIRYPELSSLRYNPATESITFTILLTGEVSPSRQTEFVEHVATYFAACKELEPKFSPVGKIVHTTLSHVTMLVYEQQIKVVNIVEMRLFMRLVQDFYQSLVSTDVIGLQAEEMDAQEEIIEQILEQRESLCDEKLIIAYRDGGKVVVYNK